MGVACPTALEERRARRFQRTGIVGRVGLHGRFSRLTPPAVCRPPRLNTRGVMTATTAMILMRPGEGHLEACPMPALNRQFTTYTLTPDRIAQKQAAE